MVERFGGLMERMREVVEEHRRLDDPLLLAVLFAPERDPDHLFLLEVIQDFASNSIDPDRELFEVSYPVSPEDPQCDKWLHLVLTGPVELQTALEQNWKSAIEIRNAMVRGDYEILFMDERSAGLVGMIAGE